MNRRRFFGGIASVVAMKRKAMADGFCNPDGYCEVGIPNINITPTQQCKQWCWAASIQAIFGLHGRFIDQKAIVQRLFGNLTCAPANNQQMFQAINGEWYEQSGTQFYAQAHLIFDPLIGYSLPNGLQIIISELYANRPLLNGALGHATVLTALTYQMSPMGPQVVSAVVRDPWPGNPNKRMLTPQEMMGTAFIAAVSVS